MKSTKEKVETLVIRAVVEFSIDADNLWADPLPEKMEPFKLLCKTHNDLLALPGECVAVKSGPLENMLWATL